MSNNCHYSNVSNTLGRFQALLKAAKPKKYETMTILLPFPSSLPLTMQTELNVIWAPDISKNVQWRDQKMSPGGRHEVKKAENA